MATVIESLGVKGIVPDAPHIIVVLPAMTRQWQEDIARSFRPGEVEVFSIRPVSAKFKEDIQTFNESKLPAHPRILLVQHSVSIHLFSATRGRHSAARERGRFR